MSVRTIDQVAHGPYTHPEINWLTARLAVRQAYRRIEQAFEYQRYSDDLSGRSPRSADAEQSARRSAHAALQIAQQHLETAARCAAALANPDNKEQPDGQSRDRQHDR